MNDLLKLVLDIKAALVIDIITALILGLLLFLIKVQSTAYTRKIAQTKNTIAVCFLICSILFYVCYKYSDIADFEVFSSMMMLVVTAISSVVLSFSLINLLDEKFMENDKFYLNVTAQMEVLAEIDKICKENGIRYFADYGTLLGAVRHKGFIPWDDDIDICMLREDYQRFHELAKRKLPKGCHLESCYIAKEWNLPFIRIVNALRLPIEKVMIEKYHGCPYVVGVDIFPIDNVPDEQAEEDVLKNAYGGLAAIGELMKQGKSLEEIEEDLQRVEEYLNIKINRKGNVINQVMRMLDNIACIYQHDDCKKVASMIFYAGNREQVRLKEWYRDSMLMPFENIQIPVPVGYEEVLQNLYGDWRRIVRNVAGHSYPFYKEQREYLKNKNL